MKAAPEEIMARADYKKPDHYSKKAKAGGFQARSVFKLEEIDAREGLLVKGKRVLDLGASPGSWMKYASRQVGKKGMVLGVDIKPLARGLSENERFIQADVNEIEPKALLEEVKAFDLVMSDMMPNTIGHKASDHYRSVALAERALEIALAVLRPGGHFLVKVFQGADFEQYRAALRQGFSKVKVKKPKSSRPTSREMYLLALGKKREGPGGGDSED